jgi:hypothetical protein
MNKNIIDLEADIRATSELVAKIKSRDDYAQNLYAAFCNMQWQRTETFPILRNDLWSVSWRTAGGIIASIRGEGDYMDWYCSGIRGNWGDSDVTPGYVPEATVTEEILNDIKQLGWHPVPWED